MSNIRQWFKNKWLLVVFTVYWGIHVYIWLIWGWQDSELFNRVWLFDEAGHALAGIVGALNLIYLYKTYSLYGIFRFSGKKHLTKDIVEDIAFFGILWEFAELIWDLYLQPNYLDWLSRAQKGAIDTVMDLVVNPLFAFITLMIYFSCVKLGKHIYKKIYPGDKNIIAVEEKVEEILEILRYLSLKTRLLEKHQLKRLIPAIRKLFHKGSHPV